jgi:hypothetical protein
MFLTRPMHLHGAGEVFVNKLQFIGVFLLCSFLFCDEKKRTKETPLGEGEVSIKRKHLKGRTTKLFGFRLISTSPPRPRPHPLCVLTLRVRTSVGLSIG